MTADLARAAAKYGALAYHLVHLDAGAALAQLGAAAAGYGLRACPLPRWDAGLLGRLLLLDPDADPVTAVAALKEPISGQPHQLVRHLLEDARRVEPPGEVPSRLRARWAGGPAVALGPPEPAGLPLEATLARRRAARRFGQGAVAATAATSLDPGHLRAARHPRPLVIAVKIARRADGRSRRPPLRAAAYCCVRAYSRVGLIITTVALPSTAATAARSCGVATTGDA